MRHKGNWDGLCHRINDSAMKVWAKLNAHLRELERKNTRLEDLRNRIKELASLPEESITHQFFSDLFSHSQMLSDPHYWDEYEKATPPQPRKEIDRRKEDEKRYIKTKKAGEGRVRSLEESRLEKLREWVDDKLELVHQPVPLSSGSFSEFEDFPRIIELTKNGLLNQGRKLEKINLSLTPAEKAVSVEAENYKLDFKEMELKRIQNKVEHGE